MVFVQHSGADTQGQIDLFHVTASGGNGHRDSGASQDAAGVDTGGHGKYLHNGIARHYIGH